MIAQKKTLLWTCAGILAGIALLLAVHSFMGAGAPPATSSSEAASSPPLVLDGKAQAAAVDQEVPPWEQGGTAAAATIARAQANPAPAVPSLSQEQITRTLGSIRQQSDRNIRAADELLAQLDEMEKSGKVPAQVQLANVRNNLQIAKRAQLLALELAELTQKPESPQRKARNDAIVAELQSLQGKLVHDAPTTGQLIPPPTATAQAAAADPRAAGKVQ